MTISRYKTQQRLVSPALEVKAMRPSDMTLKAARKITLIMALRVMVKNVRLRRKCCAFPRSVYCDGLWLVTISTFQIKWFSFCKALLRCVPISDLD
ncbi:hypothetical protein MHBO_003977 [Bonamia ostreae]|uniref:Uncharacterized protein n=1 Tax=Bonamia ostreae TaxID=126728 RepID=A0ABV2ASV2_9EUKA